MWKERNRSKTSSLSYETVYKTNWPNLPKLVGGLVYPYSPVLSPVILSNSNLSLISSYLHRIVPPRLAELF